MESSRNDPRKSRDQYINPVLRGWGNYFLTGNASDKFNQLDSYVWRRLLRLLGLRGGQRKKKAPGGRRFRPTD
jgi:hypothetical protein